MDTVMHIQRNLPNLCASKKYFRLLPALLCGLALIPASCYGKGPDAKPSPGVDAKQIVQHASFNELQASDGGHPFQYRQHTLDDGKESVKAIIETRDGDISRLLEVNGKPLDPQAAQKESDRLKKLLDNPEEQARKHKSEQADSARSNEMVRLLPDAFVYTYEGMVAGPSGPCYRLKFKPNPAFQPPDRQAEVYHGMAGELWVDQAQQRMARLDAHLISDVNFGWGVVGKLFQGGTILVKQKDVGVHHWETTHLELHLAGKILLVKSLKIESIEDSGDFAQVPDAGYKAAIDQLEAIPVR